MAQAFALYAVNDYRDDIPQSCVVNLLQPISTGFNILRNYYADLPIGDSKTYCFLSVRYIILRVYVQLMKTFVINTLSLKFLDA